MAKLKNDARIKQYKDAKGRKKYMFQLYCGINQKTGKKQVTRRRGFDTREVALLALQKLEYEVSQNGLAQKQKRKKFEEVYRQWFENYKNTVKASTRAITIQRFNKHILPAFNVYIDSIDIPMCQRVLNEWAKIVPKSFKVYRGYVSTVLKFAIHHGYINTNPMQYTLIPKHEALRVEEKETVFYNKDELLRFLSLCKDNAFLYTFFYFLAFTGVRKSEALALNWSDINLTNGMVTINKTLAIRENSQLYVSTTKTKASQRIIELDETTILVLRKWKLKSGKNSVVFWNEMTNNYCQPTSTSDWIKKIIKDTDLPKITTHGFRHTHASLLIEAGASLKEIQERLGHKNINVTANIYTHVTKNKKRDTADKLALLFQNG